MKSDGKRFHQAQLFQGQLSGIQFFSRQHNEFGEGAIPLYTESLVELASVRTSAQTGRALAAVRIWGHRYVRPRRQCVFTSWVFHHRSRYFMAQNAGIRDEWIESRNEFRSLPQNPTKRTLSSTFVSVGAGSAIVSRSAWPGLRSTSALMSVLRGK